MKEDDAITLLYMKWYTPSTPWPIDRYQNGALTDKMTNNTGSQLHNVCMWCWIIFLQHSRKKKILHEQQHSPLLLLP